MYALSEAAKRVLSEASLLWAEELGGAYLTVSNAADDGFINIFALAAGSGQDTNHIVTIDMRHGLGIALRDVKRIRRDIVHTAGLSVLARQARYRLVRDCSWLFLNPPPPTYEECLQAIQAGHEDGRNMDWDERGIHDYHVTALFWAIQ